MNFVNNFLDGVCCGIGEKDRLEITETAIFVDCETGRDMEIFGCGFVPDRTYRYEKRWMLRQDSRPIKTFSTREQARQAYGQLVEQLAQANTVINI